ncbi:MAG: hypothetical protein LBC64_03045 [Fibromonadaceae bacterium]|jgi:hypothetical protein|nr:hypothetical protein [Fibromonadaceae bacterium]
MSRNLSILTKIGALAAGMFLIGACSPSGGLKKVDNLYCMDARCSNDYETRCDCIENNDYTVGGIYSEKGSYPIKGENVELRCPGTKTLVFYNMSFSGDPIEKRTEKENGDGVDMENTSAFEQSKGFCSVEDDDDDD